MAVRKALGATKLGADKRMTVPSCAFLAATAGKRYAAIQSGSECWGSDADEADITGGDMSAGNCDRPCSGNGLSGCGGSSAMDIYQLETPDGSCQVRIRPRAISAILNLGEVQLYNKRGVQVPPAALQFQQSTVWREFGISMVAQFCNDGDVSGKSTSICHCDQNDPNPTLAIGYDCAVGLSKIVVFNRRGAEDRITAFAVDVINAAGDITQTIPFTGIASSYTFPISGENVHSPWWIADVCKGGQNFVRRWCSLLSSAPAGQKGGGRACSFLIQVHAYA
jgi:hypothetical protein